MNSTKLRRFHNLMRVGVTLAVVLCVLTSVLTSFKADAAVGINRQINFQGKLVNPNGTNVTDGTYGIVFSIYSVASAGTAIWTETQTPTVTNGIFQVNLGSVTALPGSVDFNTDNIFLGIKVGADAEMTPRIQFTAVPQAFNSEKLGGLDKTGFIQNGTTQQAATNFNISGTGVVGTSLTTPLLQSSAATALTITGNAASTWSTTAGDLTIQGGSGTVSLGTSTALASNGNLSIQATGYVRIGDSGTPTVATADDELYVLGDLEIDGNADFAGTLAVNGDIITSDGNLAIQATGYVRIGDSGTPTVATADDELYVLGDLEVDANTDLGGTLTVTGAGNFGSTLNVAATGGYYYGGTGSPMSLELTRTIPTVVNDYVEIGNFNIGSGAHNFRVSITNSDSGFSVAKTYLLPMQYNDTANVWEIAAPISESGAFAGNNYDLDVNVSNNIASLRLRRSGGSTVGTARIRIESVGQTNDVFAATTATGTATAPTVYFGSTVISQSAGVATSLGTINISNGGNLQTAGTIRLTNVGVLQNVTYNGSSITDAYIDNNLTIDWTGLQNYPTACAAGSAVTAVGDTLSCATFAPASGSNSYVQLQGATPGTAQTGNINITGTIIAGSFSGNGANLTNLNASQLTTGTVPDARITGAYTGFTNLTGSGNVDFARFLGNAADTAAAPSFTWTSDTDTGMWLSAADAIGFSTAGVNRITINASGISGAGAGLTNLNASNISTGTLNDARLSTNVPLKNAANTFSNSNTFNLTATQILTVAATQAPTTDMQVITNAGQATTTAGINGLQIDYFGGAAAVESSGQRININPGTTSGGTWNALRVSANATGPVTGVTLNGVKLEAPTTPGAGTENGLYFGAGWDNILNYNGTSIISGTGILQSAGLSGTYSNALTFSNAGNSFTGNGANLTSLNGTNITTGTVADARLSANVSLLGSSIQDAEVDNNLTIDWTGLQNYPTGCAAGSAVTAVGDALSCATFAPTSGGNYIAKNASDTSSFAVTASNYLYTFTNSSAAVASGVLRIDNGTNTGSAISVIGSGNAAANNAYIFAKNSNATPSGSLIDVQNNVSGGTSVFNVSATGSTTLKSTTNSATAFQIQDSSSQALLTANTTTRALTVSNGDLYITNPGVPAQPTVAAASNQGGTLSGASGTTYYYKITAMNAAGETLASTERAFAATSFTALTAPTAPTAAINATAGNLNGAYTYKITFVTANGETTGGTTSASVSPVSQQVDLSGIPTGPVGTTQRKIYRTAAAGADGTQSLVATLADNTTTVYTDNIADVSLGAALPGSNSARTNTNQATITYTAVAGATSYRIYRGTTSNGQNGYQTDSDGSPFTDTGAAGTAAATPVSATTGQLAVGTTAPTANLHVVGTAFFAPAQVPTADILSVANTAATAPTASGVNAAQLLWYTKPATGNTSSALRVTVDNDNTAAGGQVQGIRIAATGAGGAINSDTVGLVIDNLTSPSTGTAMENAIEIGTGWDNSIYGTGALSIRAATTNTLTLDTTGAGTLDLGVNATTITLGGGTANRTINVGNSTGTSTINVGNAAGADTVNMLTDTGGTNVFNLGAASSSNTTINLRPGTGDLNVSLLAGAQTLFTAAAVPTADMVNISNAGQAVTAAGVNNLALNFVGGAAAVEAGAFRIDLQAGTTSGSTWNGSRVVANATGPATGVTVNGNKFEGPTTGGAGTVNGINIANIGAVTTGGTVRGINITGTNSQAAGTIRGIQLNNLTAGAASEIGIDLGTGWDNLMTYNNGATVLINGSGQWNLAQVTGTLADANLSANVSLLGSSIQDAEVDNNLTIDWTGLQNYPTGCAAGSAVTAVGDTLSCATFAPASGSSNYVQLQGATPGTAQTGNINITGTIIAGSFSGNGANLTNLNASNIATGTLADARLSVRLGIVAASVTDWNNAAENGWFMAYNVPNAPTTGAWYIGDVVVHNSLWITQTLTQFTGDSNTNTATYRRSSSDVGGVRTWGAWYKLQLSQDEQDARYATLSHVHSAADITTGTLADARLSTNVSLLGQTIESGEITDATIQGLDIANDTITDTQLAFNTGQHLTTTSSPTFAGLTVNGSISATGSLTLGSLGTTNTANYLCRNSSNQLAGCNTTGTGAMFVQGGNSFGVTAVLGTNDAQSLAFETGGTTQLTIDTGGNANLVGNLSVGGRTLKLSNFNADYRWKWGGGTDLNWKKIADVNIAGSNIYAGASFEVDILDTNTNLGGTADAIPLRYYVSALRSSGTQDVPDSGTVAGPLADYVRLVKTALGVYELQVRQVTNYRHLEVTARLTSDNGSLTLTYANTPVDGSTAGTIYNASTTGYTQRFPNVNVAGSLTGTGGATISGAAVNLNNNSNFAVNIATGTSTGAVAIGGTAAQTIGIGNGATGIKNITLGSTVASSSLTLQSGAGISINASGAGNTTVAITNTGAGVANLTVDGSITAATGVTISNFATAGVVTNAAGGALSSSASLSAALGGTGQTSYTIGDLLYASGATSLGKLAAVVAGSCLISNGVGAAPIWGSCGTGAITGLTLAATSGTPQAIANSDTITIATGSTNLTTTAGATDTITIGMVNNPTFTTSVTTPSLTNTGALTVNATGAALTLQTTTSGNIVINGAGSLDVQDAATFASTATFNGVSTFNTDVNMVFAGTENLAITANGAPTADMVAITNSGQAVTAAGVNAFSVNYVGGAAAIEAAAGRIDLQPGGTTGGTWSAWRVVHNATGPATGVTSNGVKIEGPTTGGAGIFNGINIANIGATTTGGIVRGINVTATNSQAAGAIRGIQLNNLTAGAASEIGIDLGTGWDNLMTYNNGATVLINGSGQWNLAQVTGSLSDTNVSDTLTSSLFVGSGSTSTAIDLATAEVNGILGAANGGTGQNTYTIGDMLYASGATSLGKLAAVVAGSCLISNGVGAAPLWGSCSTGATLQAAYTADPDGSNAVIALTSADGAVIIRDNATPIGGSLFAVQNSAATVSYLNVTTTGIASSGSVTGVGVNAGTGAFTGTGGATISGAAVNLNNNSNFAVNIKTGTSTGTTTIGNNSNAANAVIIDGGTAANSIQIGNSTTAHGIQIGTSASAAQTIVIGSTNAGSALTLQGGTAGIIANSDFVASGAATATTGTTEATARVNVTTVTLTAAGAFANNDIIFIDNAGQDYYTRIVSGAGTTALVVSPAVSYDASASVTKYNVENIGAKAGDYATLSNRFFQGYFLGGVVLGAGSTTLSDGNLFSTGALSLQGTGGNVMIGGLTEANTDFFFNSTTGQLRINNTGNNPRLTFAADDGVTNLWNIDNVSGELRFFRESYASTGAGTGGAVRLSVTDGGDVKWSGSQLTTDSHGGSIELGSAGTPYLDFSNDTSSDFDIRMILTGDNALTVVGGDLYGQTGAVFGGTAARSGAEPIEVQGAGAGISFYNRTSGATGRWVTYVDTSAFGTSDLNFWNSSNKFMMHANGAFTATGTISGEGAFTNSAQTSVGTNDGTVCWDNDTFWAIDNYARCVSLRAYKKNIQNIDMGLGTIRLLQPRSFNWRADGKADFGFIAEEVEGVDTRLAEYDQNGLTGVHYLHMSALAIQGVKELDAAVQANTVAIANIQNHLSNGIFNNISNITVSGTANIQNLTVGTAATIAKLTVTGDTIVANLYVGGKLISRGNVPAAVLGSALTGVLGAAVTNSGTDTAGSVSIVSGTEAAQTGVLAEITFTSAYATAPKIVISGNNAKSSKLGAYVVRTATGFQIVTDDVVEQGVTYDFDYIIIEAVGVAP